MDFALNQIQSDAIRADAQAFNDAQAEYLKSVRILFAGMNIPFERWDRTMNLEPDGTITVGLKDEDVSGT